MDTPYRKKQGMLFIVSAPSGAGKTTLCKDLSGAEGLTLSHSVSHTTRKPRPDEREGDPYYFVTESEFLALRDSGGFVEWATVHGNYYGTSKAELDRLFSMGRDVILDIDTQGARKIKDSGISGTFIFILPPSMEELERRLRGRNSNDEADIKIRLARAVEEIREYRMYDYVIVNQNLLNALNELKSVVIAGKTRLESLDEVWVDTNFFKSE